MTNLSLGADIGGTHISAALVSDGETLMDSYRRTALDPGTDADTLLATWAGLLNSLLENAPAPVTRIGLAMPGPFDYANGTSLIRGLNKYESLFGLNIREALTGMLGGIPIAFANDAACFGLGAAVSATAKNYRRIIAITLGTGFGACFIADKTILTGGGHVPPNGYLYCIPYKEGIAEDYFSSRWLLKNYPAAPDVRQMAEKAHSEPSARAVFEQLGQQLGEFLAPWIANFEADALVIGGSIAHSADLFLPALEKNIAIPVITSTLTEQLAIAGAATLPAPKPLTAPARKSQQPLLPKQVPGNQLSATTHAPQAQPSAPQPANPGDTYTLYPFAPLGEGRISTGYEPLVPWIATQKGLRIDGYTGIDWQLVRQQVCAALRAQGITPRWYEARAWQKPESGIDALIKPFVGQPGEVWGTKTNLQLIDLFEPEIKTWRPAESPRTLSILAGTGAGLSEWDVPLLYLDLPKNELQYRMRAGSAVNLGATETRGFGDPGATQKRGSEEPRKTETPSFPERYKRSYFVDWPILNQHRRNIHDSIAIVADGQHEEAPNWTTAAWLREGLHQIARSGFRPRPWFEPGVWGGQWMKQHLPGLAKKEINYAWSFECIAPENGIVFESDGLLLETAFDWLMAQESPAVLGQHAGRFGEEFPIRFDFLDTFDGGNLSIQCHPSLPYIQKQFGETLTQDETYYILDCTPGAGVFLGFMEDIEPNVFRTALQQSQTESRAFDISRYVQRLPAHKHDLFLIPNQTIHGSGVNNLVLEISATPYIFTFKMYDWMRLDLDGRPRPINIEHAFRNLDFSRKGDRVQTELVSQPHVLEQSPGRILESLPTHPEHFYAIHRVTLDPNHTTTIPTGNRFHLLMLVEGASVLLRTRGRTHRLQYAETFILPAAAGEYELQNPGPDPIKMIKAFVK